MGIKERGGGENTTLFESAIYWDICSSALMGDSRWSRIWQAAYLALKWEIRKLLTVDSRTIIHHRFVFPSFPFLSLSPFTSLPPYDLTMSTTTYLVTGSSRSLGLGYASQLLQSSTSTRVIAAVRNPSKADQLEPLIKEFGKERVYVLECDVNEAESTQVSFRFSIFARILQESWSFREWVIRERRKNWKNQDSWVKEKD